MRLKNDSAIDTVMGDATCRSAEGRLRLRYTVHDDSIARIQHIVSSHVAKSSVDELIISLLANDAALASVVSGLFNQRKRSLLVLPKELLLVQSKRSLLVFLKCTLLVFLRSALSCMACAVCSAFSRSLAVAVFVMSTILHGAVRVSRGRDVLIKAMRRLS